MPSGSVTPAGGAAFNGGTITQPLVISPSSNTPPLVINMPVGSSVAGTNAISVRRESGGGQLMFLDAYGELFLFADVIDAANGGGAVFCNDSTMTGKFQLNANSDGANHATLGLYGHAGAAQPTLTSGTATPEQIALALQSYGAAGGT